MELLTRVVIIVWCSTVVRYTFAEGDLMKELCLNKKSKMASNPFQITETDPTDIKTGSSKIAKKSDDLFNEIENTANVKKITEVFHDGFYSALCWIEITTIIEFKNGSNNIMREYAISFESPSDIPKKYIAEADELPTDIVPYKIFDQDTKKSEIINFTTIKKNGNNTVRQNRKILCGSGPIYTKEYFEWLNSNKKKIELRVSPKKQSLVASECKDDQQTSNGENTNADNILEQKETISKFPVNSTEDLNNSSNFSAHVSQKVEESPHKVTTENKLLQNDETTSITVRLGSENFKLSDAARSDNIHGSSNLNRPGDINNEILLKIDSESITDNTVSTSSQSQAENYSTVSEKFITSTEGTSFTSEEYSSSETSQKLTTNPQSLVTEVTVTKDLEDVSASSTITDYDYEKRSTKNTDLPPVDEDLPKKSTHISNITETSTSTVTNSNKGIDNSKDIQPTDFKQNSSTLSLQITVTSSPVTKGPILSTSSQKLENVNTPKPPESENGNTEKSRSTSSVQEIPETTTKEAHVTANLLQNITVSNTDSPLNVTQTPKELNITVSTVKYEVNKDSINATVTNQVSTENYQQLNIPLNKTEEKIRVKVNVLTDHILEGTKNGKNFRNITPLIGVEKTIEFNFQFENQALETYKKELGYNWDKFMEDLIQRFFGNRTNDSPNNMNNIKIECQNKVVNTGSQFDWDIPQSPTPDVNLNALNYSNEFLTPNQQINNPYLLFQNQPKPTVINKYKEKFDSIHTFTYPPIDYSKNSAVLFKDKQPVFRSFNLIKPENRTNNLVNYSLPSFRTFGNLKMKPPSVILQKVLNLTKTPFVANYDGKKSDDASFNMNASTKNDIGYRGDSFFPLVSDQVADELPVFRVPDSTYILQKLKDFHNLEIPKHLTTETIQNPQKVEVEEKNEENKKPGFFNNMFGVISSSFSSN